MSTHSALVRLLAGVTAHVHDQHVLRLEALLPARAVVPPTHERLLVRLDVVLVQVLQTDATGTLSFMRT